MRPGPVGGPRGSASRRPSTARRQRSRSHTPLGCRSSPAATSPRSGHATTALSGKYSGNTAMQAPADVATPFPPRKRVHTGKMWPAIDVVRGNVRPTIPGDPPPDQAGDDALHHVEHHDDDAPAPGRPSASRRPRRDCPSPLRGCRPGHASRGTSRDPRMERNRAGTRRQPRRRSRRHSTDRASRRRPPAGSPCRR